MMCGSIVTEASAEEAVVSETGINMEMPVGDTVPQVIIELTDEQLQSVREQMKTPTYEHVTNFNSGQSYTYSSSYLYNTLSSAEKEFYAGMDSACRAVLSSTTDYTATVNFGGSFGEFYVAAEVPFSDITFERAINIEKIFKYSNPQYYFISNTVGSYSDEIVLLFGKSYNHDFSKYSERSAVQSALNTLVTEWMPDIEAANGESRTGKR